MTKFDSLSDDQRTVLETPFKDLNKLTRSQIDTRGCIRDIIKSQEVDEKRKKVKNLKFPNKNI